MASFPDPLSLPDPCGVAGRSHPLIDFMLEGLGDDARGLYRRYLAEEARRSGPTSGACAWRAFDRALVEDLRRRVDSGGT